MTLSWKQYLYAVGTQGVSILAEQEAAWSNMPGIHNGPADAYRHILLAAELTRRYGEENARRLLDAHEWTGKNDGQPVNEEEMDKYNNELGIDIGNRLANDPNKSWDDVIDEARQLIDPNDNYGDGARWFYFWDENSNPKDETDTPIPNGDPRLNWPVEWKDGPYYDYPSSLFDKWFKDGVNDLFDFFGDISDDVNLLWHAFKNWVAPRRDPLVLDLDGDGIETLGVNATTHVVFDYDGDGIKTGTGWIAGDDGFVVLDRNGNGTIDNGGELFGDQTLVGGAKASDGFAALSAEDTNKNGKFDAGDTNFTKVRIWQDTNSDGISQAGELHTLNELGITSINLTSTVSNTLSNGNIQIAAGTYTKTNGTTGESGTLNLTEDTGNAGNLNFSQNPFYSEFTDHLTLTDTALALPDMQGSGMVRDLREASTLSAGLTSTLQSMSTTYETRDEMMTQIDTLLAQWAETSSMATSVQIAEANGNGLIYLPSQSASDIDLYFRMTSSGSSSIASATDLQRYQYLQSEQTRISAMINILEQFNGEHFVTVEPNSIQAGSGTVTSIRCDSTDTSLFVGLSGAQVSFIEQSYVSLKQSVYDGLVIQTRLNNYINTLNFTIDENGINVDDTVMMQMISDRIATDPKNALIDMIELRQYVGTQLGTFGWDSDKCLSEILAASDGVYDVTAIFGNYGMSIADGTYTGSSTNDYVWGKQRDDTINTGSGNDTLYGGEGDDALQGGGGNDIYVFYRGDGHDTIYDYDNPSYSGSTYYYNAGNETIRFGAGINARDVVARAVGNDLILAIKEEGVAFENLNDTITITNWYHAYNRIENIEFTDGTVLSTTSTILGLISTDGDDLLQWTGDSLTIDTKGGNDTVTANNSVNNTIHGGDGNDTIMTGNGADIVYGDAGDDTIIVGIGDDTLYGGDGNDTLIGEVDWLSYPDPGYKDTLIGGQGNDTLHGGAGNDTYIYRRGDGYDTVYDYDNHVPNDSAYNAGNDTIQFDGGISAGDVVARVVGNDLILAIKEEGVSFENLSDTITITNWYNVNNRIENITFADGTKLSTVSAILSLAGTEWDDTIIGTEQGMSLDAKGGNDTVVSLNGASTIHGGEGNDTITTGSGNDSLYGDAGDDSLYSGQNGNDTLSGGVGNDLLQGGMGNDMYVFNRGDGHDTIFDSVNPSYTGSAYYYNAGNDTIRFGTGINTEDVIVKANGRDLILAIKEEGVSFENLSDTITITNWFNVNNQVENILFADGSIVSGVNAIFNLLVTDGDDTINATELPLILDAKGGNDTVTANNSANNTIHGGDGNDTIMTGNGADAVYGDAGDDTIMTGNGADIVYGDAGDDTIIAGYGKNTLYGGNGNDILHGGDEDDTYVFNRGDGHDTIYDPNQSYYYASGDTIQFGTGINTEDVIVKANGRDLILALKEEGKVFDQLNDTITITNWYNANNRIENIRFVDGTTMGIVNNILNLLVTDGDDTINATELPLTLDAKGGNDTVTANNSANNTIHGGDGNDTIMTGNGADAVYGDAGDDTITAGTGHDTLYGGDGNDTLIGDNTSLDFNNEYADTLIGGEGDDVLRGEGGNDTYVFNLGDGHDTIYDYQGFFTSHSAYNAGNDTIQFGEGIKTEDLSFFINGNDWIIEYSQNDKVTITDWFNVNNSIESIKLFDGVTESLSSWKIGTVGNDVLDGMNKMYGGVGDDTYIVDSVTNLVIEQNDEGTDTVQSSITYALNENVENLTLTGTETIDGIGNTLNNVLIGNSADNVLDGGAGADTMIGGLGNDIYVVDNIGDIVTENIGKGIDTLQSSVTYTLSSNVENLILTGTGSINAIGNELNNNLTGNSGDNVLDGGAGVDTMIGDTGNDTYVVDNTADIVTEHANEGTDTVQSSITYVLGANVENLTLAGTAAINGTGNTLNNIIYANSANNVLDGGAGVDTLSYANASSAVTVNLSLTTAQATGGSGSDTIKNFENITGSNYNDTLTGSTGNNILDGGTGADTMVGGTENDTYIVDNTGDVVTEAASAGTDTVCSSITYTLGSNVENLTMTGTAAINGTGNTLNNVLIGNDAENLLNGGSGADAMSGGKCNDTYVVDNIGDIVTENAGEGIDTVQSSITYTLGANVENLTLTGTKAINGTGNTLDNTLIGNRAANILTGGFGNDILNGGAGADTMIGGSGDDTYVVDNTKDVVTENAGEGIDTVQSSITYTLGANVENLTLTGTKAINGTGNTLNNIIYANSANNVLDGGAGVDMLSYANASSAVTVNLSLTTAQATGGSGSDTIKNFENITGSNYNDTLTGNTGDNVLMGGAGNDTFYGGSGNDTYIFNRGDGIDIISDYASVANTDGGTDTLSFGMSIGINDIAFFKNGNNLQLSYGVTDSVTVVNDFNTNNAIEKFTLADGNYLTSNDLNVIIQSMNAYATDHGMSITSLDNVKANQDLMSIVAGAWHK